MAQRIVEYAGDDAELAGLARELQQDAVAHEERLSSVDRKIRYMRSASSLMSRDAAGAATRRPNRPGSSA